MLFKQMMLPEKKSGFFPQHDKGFMQLRLRDILGNYAEKNGGTARIALLINSPLFAKLRGVLRKCGPGRIQATGGFFGNDSFSEYAVPLEIELRMTANPCCSSDFSAVVKESGLITCLPRNQLS